jgi:replicative superfamily II helicase
VRGFVTDREYNYLSVETLSPRKLPGKPVNYVAVMTPEKLRLAVSLWPDAFHNCALCVLDEAHLIGENRRGALLDLALAQLRTQNPRMPLLLTSAMMGNSGELAEWLGGMPYVDERRGTRQALMLGIPDSEAHAKAVATREKRGDLLLATVYRSDWEPSASNIRWLVLKDASVLKQERVRGSRGWGPYRFKPSMTAINCVERMVRAGFKTILFRPDIHVESSARRIADALGLEGADDAALAGWQRVLARELGVRKPEIVDMIRRGVCYHKAPMLSQEQVLAERYFAQDRRVRLIVCTSTLTHGVNLPVEVIVFAGNKRYDPETDRSVEISSKDFLNIAGRAG